MVIGDTHYPKRNYSAQQKAVYRGQDHVTSAQARGVGIYEGVLWQESFACPLVALIQKNVVDAKSSRKYRQHYAFGLGAVAEQN